MDKFPVPKIAFLCEQDGPVETELSRQLCSALLTEPEVMRAYLVRVHYEGELGNHVVLGLEGGEDNAARIIDTVGRIFKQLFNPRQSLDVLFLNPAQMEEVSSVAAPFYRSIKNSSAQVN